MSSALDVFEESLVEASRALHVPARLEQPRRASTRGRTRRRRRLFVPGALVSGLAAALWAVFALLPSGGGLPELGVGQASAQAVLARAALIAAATPASTVPNAHQFLYIEWIRSFTGGETIKHHTFRLTNGQTEQDWEAPNGSGRQKLSNGFYRFLSPADHSAWLAAGRPTVNPTPIDGTYPKGAYFNECGIAPRGTIGLSTNPTRLLQQVIARYEGHHYSPGATLSTATCILVTSAYPPLRAATYRMIEHLHGVRYLGAMRDGTGRRGVALAVPDPKEHLNSIVIFDRVTAKPLELELVQTRRQQQLPAGAVVESQILLSSGVVKTDEALPDGGEVAFKHPPKIKVTEPAVPASPAQPTVSTLAGLRGELSILRRPQVASDALPAWAVKFEERQGCSNCLNIPKLIPSATRLLTTITFKAPPPKDGFHGPESVYLVVGALDKAWGVKRSQKNQIPTVTMNGWHQRGAELSGLHLSIVGFVPKQGNWEQPIDTAQNLAETTMPAGQPLNPRDVMVGQFGTVGIVPDGVTRVRWELIDQGQSHPITVYPKIEGNVATAPLTRTPDPKQTGLTTEQMLASAVWYGANGKVIASANDLPGLLNANSNW